MSCGPKQVALIQDPKPRGLVVNQNQERVETGWETKRRKHQWNKTRLRTDFPGLKTWGRLFQSVLLEAASGPGSQEALISPESRSVIEK